MIVEIALAHSNNSNNSDNVRNETLELPMTYQGGSKSSHNSSKNTSIAEKHLSMEIVSNDEIFKD